MTPKRNRYNWTPEEFNYIRSNFMEMTDSQMGINIGRTNHAITQKRIRLKLFRRPKLDEFKYLRLKKLSELRKAVLMSKVINRMKVLIYICEHTSNNYKKDKFKSELRKLSGL